MSFSDLIIKFWDYILKYILFIYFRQEGFVIIRKTYGKPNTVFDEKRWCWKIPILQSFDIVDMRNQTFTSSAHSFFIQNNNIPHNIVIDTQVEFKIKDPFIIYRRNTGVNNSINMIHNFVSNDVHLLIQEAVASNKKITKLKINELQDNLNKILINSHHQEDDKQIIIERIIVTSFDYNISLRLAQ